MSRYILKNLPTFEDKTVIELGSGTGIVGLTLIKYSGASKVVFTDYL